ncbi:hypothetical protein [Halalkalibaculum sp. DA384]|uniref:TetR/AcrR family transcriptional regulator n=1 Tax=Halalkalibaculum sp. DA384 TaxID=3373606 RepID=UPI0037552541
MNKTDPGKFEFKYRISEAAVEQYEKEGKNFTLKQVSRQADCTVADILEYFPGKKAILQFYYTGLLVRYRLMLEDIEGFDDYLLAEKLSNFVYTSFDLLDEHKSFVRETFTPLIFCSYSGTGFEQQTRELLERFFSGDPRISSSSALLMNRYFYQVLYRKYTVLIRFWLKDTSEEQEVSMELTDKYTAFLQELMYSAAVDKGFDLAKFLFSNAVFSSGFQSIKNLFPEIEIRD